MNEIAEKIVAKLSRERNFDVPIKVHFCDDFLTELPKYITNKRRLEAKLNNPSSKTGQGIYLEFEKNAIHVLVRTNADPSFIIHEVTHAIDYHKFISQCCNGDFDTYDEPNSKHYELANVFGWASEFNASRVMWRACANLDDGLSEVQELFKWSPQDPRYFYRLIGILGKICAWEQRAGRNDHPFVEGMEMYAILKRIDFDNIDAELLRQLAKVI